MSRPDTRTSIRAPMKEETGYNPSWPPLQEGKKRGKATRLVDFSDHAHNAPSANASCTSAGDESSVLCPPPHRIFDPDTSNTIIGSRTSEAAKAMATAPSPMTRLVARTLDDSKMWSPGKKSVSGPVSDVGAPGFNVVRPEPLIIRGKVRRGCANSETTNIIAHEISDREAKRRSEVEAAEKSRAFHSFFSEQPAHRQGTSHVKPIWATPQAAQGTFSLNQQQQQQRQQQQQQSIGLLPPIKSGNNNMGAVSHASFLPPLANYNQQQQQQQASSASSAATTPAPLQLFDGPPGLPGVGQADMFRTRHGHGKKQIEGAHRITSLVEGQRPLGFAATAATAGGGVGGGGGGGGNGSTLPDFHQKLPDGSRGLRVAPQRNEDNVRDTFAADTAAQLMRSQKFVTTSSSIGNPVLASEQLAFVNGISHRVGRHVTPAHASAFPPVGTGGLASVSFRSGTPFPMSTAQQHLRQPMLVRRSQSSMA